MAYKTIEEIRNDYNAGKYSYHVDIPRKLPSTYVFDRNLTIAENERRIAEHNQNVDEMARDARSRNAELSRQLTNDVVAYIAATYHMSEAQAALVESYVYREKHSFMGDYFANIDDVAEMVESVLLAK